MRRRKLAGAAVLFLWLCVTGGGAAQGRSVFNVTDPAVWQLTWSDEFNGPNIDTAKWTQETGGWGWGNNELEYYTARPQNSFIENGHLVIKALQETYTGPDNVTRNYTSARLITKNKFTQRYGRFEARLKVPFGQGLWPAFWLLGDNIDTTTWPTCGEIDIMENIGREPAIVHGTLHGPGYSGGDGPTAAYTLPGNQRFADKFHTFAIEWEPNVVRFYVDGRLYKTRAPADLPAGRTWVFDHPFFLLLNVAVGGGWPGNPDNTTVFPQTMQVDYVRVYQRPTPSSAPLILAEDGTNRALALDSVTHLRDPFTVAGSHNLSLDGRTRVSFFLANADLWPDDTESVASAQAENAQGQILAALPVEYVGRVEEFDWITQLVVRLPDPLAHAGDVWITANLRGQNTNRALITVN